MLLQMYVVLCILKVLFLILVKNNSTTVLQFEK